MIDPGTYLARATSSELGYTANGKEQIGISFSLVDQPGTYITWYGGFSNEINGNAKKSPCERTFETLRTCGWEGDDLSDLGGIESNEVELVIDIEDDQNGVPRNRVKWVNAPGGGGPAMKNVMPVDQKKAFAAKMKGAALASKQKMGAQKPVQPRPQSQRQAPKSTGSSSQYDESDDIPF
jgi:hypothetical protein